MNLLLLLQVKYSQRMSATPLLPWVVIKRKGEILPAHCTCMARPTYRMAGNFCGVLIFVIFVVNPGVTKFSTHEIFHLHFLHMLKFGPAICVMALFRYLRPFDSALDLQGPLSQAVPHVVIEEVSKEVKKAEAQPKKRGQYLLFTAEEKVQVARYASTNGVRAAVRHFSVKFGKDLKENTVRDWVKAYNKELQSKSASTEIGDDLAVMKLPSKRRGRPCLWGERIDIEVQTILRAMHDNGAVVNT